MEVNLTDIIRSVMFFIMSMYTITHSDYLNLRIVQYYALFAIIILRLSASGRIWFPVSDVIALVHI